MTLWRGGVDTAGEDTTETRRRHEDTEKSYSFILKIRRRMPHRQHVVATHFVPLSPG
jgi:hypothetical protein